MVFVGMFMMALLEICTTRGGSSVEAEIAIGLQKSRVNSPRNSPETEVCVSSS